MNTPLRNLQKEALLLKLSSTEKAALHATIMSHVRASSPSADASAPRSAPSPYFFFFAPKFAVPLAALLVVLLGGGTAFAAQGSLPGDPLYAVKVKVSEPLQGALAVSTEDKIKFHTQVVQTRLEEAEVLASQNRLDATTTAELESNLDTHLAARAELASKLSDDSAASDEATAELDSSVAAHGEVLAALGGESSSSTTRENSDALASKVRINRGPVVAMAMSKTAVPMMAPAAAVPSAVHPTIMAVSLDVSGAGEASSSASSTQSAEVHVEGARMVAPVAATTTGTTQTHSQKNALSLEARATSSIETLKRAADAARAHLSADVAAKLDARLANIAGVMAQGEASLADNDFDSASESFSQALNRSVTLSTFLSANARFDNGILGNLLKHGQNSDEDN